MAKPSKRVFGFGALACAALLGLSVLPNTTSASDWDSAVLLAQANDGTKGKSDGNTGRPSNQAPNTNQPGNQAPIPSSPALQNAPQSGVPARCASVADATERQKCMNTPKGQ